MPKSPAISALRRKRAQILGAIKELDGQAERLRHDLAHVDATLSLLDPAPSPGPDRAAPPPSPRSRFFARKELSVRVMTALGEAARDWETAESIAAKIMADKGLADLSGPVIRKKTQAVLRIMEKRGLVISDGLSGRWALRP
jgi:hypothetical protein